MSPTIQHIFFFLTINPKGLKEKYELHHGISISDKAIVSAATLSNRYMLLIFTIVVVDFLEYLKKKRDKELN